MRQQRHRAEKGQQEMHAIINMGFKTKQSKGKVMRRVNNALPSTPTKKAYHEGVQFIDKLIHRITARFTAILQRN